MLWGKSMWRNTISFLQIGYWSALVQGKYSLDCCGASAKWTAGCHSVTHTPFLGGGGLLSLHQQPLQPCRPVGPWGRQGCCPLWLANDQTVPSEFGELQLCPAFIYPLLSHSCQDSFEIFKPIFHLHPHRRLHVRLLVDTMVLWANANCDSSMLVCWQWQHADD